MKGFLIEIADNVIELLFLVVAIIAWMVGVATPFILIVFAIALYVTGSPVGAVLCIIGFVVYIGAALTIKRVWKDRA